MNNKRQKNIVYSYNGIETIPYSDSNLGKNELTKNSTTMNNAFRQLLDNDLFIENELNKVENNVVGPKGDGTEQTLKNSADGYKFWGGIADVGELSVLHKIESKPQDSVVRFDEKPVKFIFGYGSAMFVASDRLRFTEDGENFTELGDITANGYYCDDRNVMFAANDGIYVLTTQVVGFGVPSYDIVKVNRNNIGVVTTVELDEGGRRIIAGTERGIYIGEIPGGNGDLNKNVTFYKKAMDNVGVNDIQIVDSGKSQLVATDSGMYKSVDSVGFRHVVQYGIDDGKECKCSTQFGDGTYFGMTDGLYRMSEEGPVKIYGTDDPVISFSVNGPQLFFSTDKTIYCIDRQGTVTTYKNTDLTIAKIQRVVIGSKGGVFILAQGKISLILDDDMETVIPVQVTNEEILDFIVKTGVRNNMFVQTRKDVLIIDINGIYTYESDVPDTANEYHENTFINENLSGFIGLMESDNGLFAVTSRCLANIVNPDLHYDVPDAFGDIVTYQHIRNGNGMKYLLVCEKSVILLGSSLNTMRRIDAGSKQKFLGGYCGSNFMVLFTNDGTQNRTVSYSFPGNIQETESVDLLSGDIGPSVVEDDASIFFTVNGQLMYASKENVFTHTKEESGVRQFGLVDIVSPDATCPAILKRGGDCVSIDIVVGMSVDTDDGDESAYHLATSTLSVGKSGVGVNGMLFEGNTLYSLTEDGVTETPIMHLSAQEFVTLDQTAYLTGLSICGGALMNMDINGFASKTGMFVDTEANVHVRYEKPDNELVKGITVDIGAVLSDEITVGNNTVPFFAYSDGVNVYATKGTTEKSVAASGVKRLLMTNTALLAQSLSGVCEIKEVGNNYTLSVVDELRGFGVGMIYNIADDSDDGMDEIIFASGNGLKRYVQDSKTVTITDLWHSSTRRIVSISKISENRFVINHGDGYSVCEIGPSGKVNASFYKYPKDKDNNYINSVVFFSMHGNNILILKLGSKYYLNSYSANSNFDIDNSIEIVGYCDTEDDTIYATQNKISNGRGDTLYYGDGIMDVFASDSDRGTEAWFQDSTGLKHVTTSWETKKKIASGITNIWHSDGFVFFTKRNGNMDDLYFHSGVTTSIDSVGGIFNTTNATPLFSDPSIRDVTVSAGDDGTHIYVLTDSGLHTWTYDPTDSNASTLIREKGNYRRINLGNISGSVRQFIDGRIMFSKDGSDIDITDTVFQMTSGGDAFINHGMFLCDDGFYQMDEDTCTIGGHTEMDGWSSVTKLMTIGEDIVFGSSESGKGGVYDIVVSDDGYAASLHDFGDKTYTCLVMTMFVANDIPYIKNTKTWKMLSDGEFVPVTAFMGNDTVKPEFSNIVGISDSNGTAFAATGDKLYTLGYRTQYDIDLKRSSTHRFDGGVNRIVDDVQMVRVLATDEDPNLLTEHKAYVGVDGVHFSQTGMPKSIEVVYVNNTATSGEKFTRDDSGYHVVHNDTDIRECPDIDLGKVRALVKQGGLYIVGMPDKVFTFDGIGDDVAYEPAGDNRTKFYKIVPISDSQYLMCAQDGLHTYYAQTGLMLKNSVETKDIPSLATYRLSEYDPQSYICGSADGQVLTSTNHKRWDLFVQIPDVRITDVFVRNSKQYYIGTDKGLYWTSYKYQLVNDIPMYTMENASELYNSMYDTLSAMVQQVIDEHVSASHGPSSFIGHVNDEILSTDFSPIVDFYREDSLCSGSELCSCNDLVAEMYTSDVADGSIVLSISNFLSTYQAEDFSYVMKRYTSGVTELFIYVPTTNTYYLPHVDGSSYCTVSKEVAIKRRNLSMFEIGKQSVKSTTDGNYTDIAVQIDSSRFHVDSVMDIEINGNSLPLKIYKDSEYVKADGDAVYMFHSRIYPSVVRKYDISRTDESRYYTFRFSCFGSDAQAIRICFYDSTKRDK